MQLAYQIGDLSITDSEMLVRELLLPSHIIREATREIGQKAVVTTKWAFLQKKKTKKLHAWASSPCHIGSVT
jgi:hypothetical protein